jgi:hypothetical protein
LGEGDQEYHRVDCCNADCRVKKKPLLCGITRTQDYKLY